MILVVAAMQEEIKEIALSMLPNTHLIVTGVGKVNAAMKLSEIIQKEKVEAIVNLGFAGAKGSYEVGELVLVEKAKYHDFDLSLFGYEEGQVPGYPTYYYSDSFFVHKIERLYPNIKKSQLLTGDYFTTNTNQTDSLFDMEAASLFQVAYHYQIPMISLKVVSDVVHNENQIEKYRQFEANHGSFILNQVYQKLFGGQS